MINILLSLIAATSLGLSSNYWNPLDIKNSPEQADWYSEIPSVYPQIDTQALRRMLKQQAPSMSEAVINKIATAVKCSSIYAVDNNNILSVIDYSLPSNQKRLWIFDLENNKLLFHTYVSHGIKSGTFLTRYFSNKYNSKASSIGVYKTEKAYYGREGLSLRLAGLERQFNDNAMNRSIVMHGGWYMDEQFIKHYGRPGRSWGCPAVPLDLYQGIINTIKDNSLLIVYYPSDEWFGKSRFLTCDKNKNQMTSLADVKPVADEQEHRDDVFFAQVHKGGEDKPILVMPAPQYEAFFQSQAPLGRMLRRRINQQEYIALNTKELERLSQQKSQDAFQSVYFVIPTLRQVRGYYETEMKIINLGVITEINPSVSPMTKVKEYNVHFNSTASIRLQSTDRFIRWLGL